MRREKPQGFDLLRVIRPEAGEEPAGFFDMPCSYTNKNAKKIPSKMSYRYTIMETITVLQLPETKLKEKTPAGGDLPGSSTSDG
jgi:hypothetical protein